MQKVFEILELLENTSGRNDKISILQANKDNIKLKNVLFYTYNVYFNYGISEKFIKSKSWETLSPVEITSIDANTIFDILDYLRLNNASNATKGLFKWFLQGKSPMEIKWYTRMVLKNLRINTGIKVINKAYGENILPVYEVQRAKVYQEHKDKIMGKEVAVTRKENGVRLTVRHSLDSIEFITRQGKPIDGLNDLKKEFELLAYGTYDGEVLVQDPEGKMSSNERYRKTVAIVNSDLEDKKDLEYICFDFIHSNEFDTDTATEPYSSRRKFLDSSFNKCKLVSPSDLLYVGVAEESTIDELLDEAVAKDWEGIMINLMDKPYACKRTNNILKYKKYRTVDLRVWDMYEGQGDIEGKMGGVTVKYKGNPVNIGTGFTLKQREEFWKHRDLIIGKIIEIKFQEESKNQKNDMESLVFARFSHIRFDKDEESYD